MKKFISKVIITPNGNASDENSSGVVEHYLPLEVGEGVTISSKDENGMPFTQAGKLVEIFETVEV